MADFTLKDISKEQNTNKAICLSGEQKDYIIIEQDDVIIIKDTVKNRDGVVFVTPNDEVVYFASSTLKREQIPKEQIPKAQNTISQEEEVFKIELLSGIKSNMVFTKKFNHQAAQSSTKLGDFVCGDFVLRKNIIATKNKIYFLQGLLKSTSQITLQITLQNYEQSKDSIGFDGNISDDFDYKYSVKDESLEIFIKASHNSKEILDRFYFKTTSNCEQKTFDIKINNLISYQIIIKRHIDENPHLC